jgi:hypothetical protein
MHFSKENSCFSGSVITETKLGAKFLASLVAVDHNPTNQARQQRENPSKRPADSNKCWNMRFFFQGKFLLFRLG